MGAVGGFMLKLPFFQLRAEPIHVTAELNHKLMPIARNMRYADPLDEVLSARKLGEVDGGGTLQSASGEILTIDVELYLNDLDAALPVVLSELEARGAPKGSKLIYEVNGERREVPVGKAEGVALYLDGVNLPKEVYKNSDVNVLIEMLNDRTKDIGKVESWWEGPEETALYLYGRDAAELKRRISDVLEEYPLCQGARVEVIAPRPQRG